MTPPSRLSPSWRWLAACLGIALVLATEALGSASYPGIRTNEFLRSWQVLGPIRIFPGEPRPEDQAAQREAFTADLLADHGGEAAAAPASDGPLTVRDQTLAWRHVDSPTDVVNLVQGGVTNDYAIAYAVAEIEMPEAGSLAFGLGSDDAVRVWLNGKLVHERWTMRACTPDEDLVRFDFVRGTNRLVLKVLNGQGDWAFACRPLGQEVLNGALVRAAVAGDLEGANVALACGADVNGRRHGLTGLQAVRIAGDEAAAALLTARGADADASWPGPEEVIESRLREATRGQSSGVAVLVARDGRVLFEGGWGYANVENEVPFTPATKSRIGSVTKQFTSAAILKLAEQGKLTVQDRLEKYYPDFRRGGEVTLHHLLTHTSGIHNYTAKPDFLREVTVGTTPDDLIRSFQDDAFDFDPGERWAYCNSGYFLLGAIVEKVAGCSYGAFLEREFFAPLGMTNTGVHTATAILKHEASGYSYAGGRLAKAINWDMSRAGGAGALYSTVEDLYRWNEGVFNGRVLKEASLKAAWTPVVTQQDATKGEPKETGYGYGWAIGKHRGLRRIDHGGGLHGFLSFLVRYPDQALTVAVLANASDPPAALIPETIATQIAELYLWREMKPRERPKVVSLDVAALETLVGRYDYGGPILTVTRDGDRLFAQLTGQPPFEIFAKSADTFFWKVVEAEVRFVKNEAGQVVKAIHQQGGAVIEAPRHTDEPVVKVTAEVLESYVGRYDYAQAGLILTITREGDRLFAEVTGQPRFEIYPRSESEFFWKVVAARITFLKDADGKVRKAVTEQGGQRLEARRVE